VNLQTRHKLRHWSAAHTTRYYRLLWDTILLQVWWGNSVKALTVGGGQSSR